MAGRTVPAGKALAKAETVLIRCRVIIVAMAVLAALSGVAAGRSSAPGAVDLIVVNKSEHLLELFKNGEVIRSYPVALGKNPNGPKTRQGDRKTPEGSYVIDRRNARSRFYRALHISYPNRADRKNAEKLGALPGGNIMIHGLPQGMAKIGELHSLDDWTNGCIAVTNAEMDEIWRLVPIGTPVEIRP